MRIQGSARAVFRTVGHSDCVKLWSTTQTKWQLLCVISLCGFCLPSLHSFVFMFITPEHGFDGNISKDTGGQNQVSLEVLSLYYNSCPSSQ